MFYVANIVTLIIVSELLWKSTLLIRYKLNSFHPPMVNQFDIRALLFGCYARFIPLDKTVFYGYWKTLPSSSFLVLHIALTLFPLCNGLCCSLSNYYFNNYNSVLHYVCFYYFLSGWNYIIFPTLNYRRNKLTELSCDVSS